QRTSGSMALGVVLSGFAKPVNDLSRGCSVDDIADMICVTSLQADNPR
ncbi:MAG: phosphate acyltransferase, partial [Bacilli bacterium]